MNQEGGYEEDVMDRVKLSCAKWFGVSGVVCDKIMRMKLKSHIYKTIVLTFVAEILVIHKNEERLLERMEMRMLRWIAGISLMERRHKEMDVLCITDEQ